MGRGIAVAETDACIVDTYKHYAEMREILRRRRGKRAVIIVKLSVGDMPVNRVARFYNQPFAGSRSLFSIPPVSL